MTQLLDEVYASNPADKIPYVTIELNHSAFRDELEQPTSIRLVRGHKDLTATLEAAAPFDPSTAVTFTAAAVAIKPPDKGIKGRQEMSLTIDAASGEIIRQLERVVAASREPIKVIYRVFVSSDLSAPQNTPVQMTILNPQVTPERVSARAVFTDVINKAFPSIYYTTITHPGLA